jgi:hypothetical protein
MIDPYKYNIHPKNVEYTLLWWLMLVLISLPLLSFFDLKNGGYNMMNFLL